MAAPSAVHSRHVVDRSLIFLTAGVLEQICACASAGGAIKSELGTCSLWTAQSTTKSTTAASGTTPTAPTATCEHGAGACGGGQMRVRPLPCGGVAVATECRAGRMRRCGRRGRARGVRCLGTSPASCGSVERALGARNKHVITSVGSLALASQAAAIARVAQLSVYNGQTASRVTRLPASRRRLTPTLPKRRSA